VLEGERYVGKIMVITVWDLMSEISLRLELNPELYVAFLTLFYIVI